MIRAVYLSSRDNGYHLALNGENKDRQFYHLMTNDIETVSYYINNMSKYFVSCKIDNDDLHVFRRNNSKIVIKNYSLLKNDEILTKFNRVLDETAFLRENIVKETVTNFWQKNLLKIKYMNKNRLKQITACILLTTTLTASVNIIKDVSNNQKAEEQIEYNFEMIREKEQEEQIEADKRNEIEESFILENRLREAEEAASIYPEYDSNTIMVGARADTEFMKKFIESDTAKLFFKYGQMYGVDPYLLIAKGMTESSLDHESTVPGGSNYNGYAVGIMQLESPELKREIQAYNYLTNCTEIIDMTMEKACNIETNIQMSAMIFQNVLHQYKNNIYLAIQSYNYGAGAMNIALNHYSEMTGRSKDAIITDVNDLGWLEVVKDIHNNPKNYLKSWKHKNYGNAKYVSNVLSYYVGTYSKNIDENNEVVIFDLANRETVNYPKVYSATNHIRNA